MNATLYSCPYREYFRFLVVPDNSGLVKVPDFWVNPERVILKKIYLYPVICETLDVLQKMVE